MSYQYYFAAGGSGNFFLQLQWATARGTPGTTATPNISNSSKRGVAPVSGLVIDKAPYSVQPTLDATPFGLARRNTFGNFLAREIFPSGLYIPAGMGVAFVYYNSAPTSAWPLHVSISWLED
jgi:hypothetical protein